MEMDRGGGAPRPTEPETFVERIMAPGPVLIYRAATDDLSFTYLSANFTSILGYAPEEALWVPGWWPGHIHPEDRERVLERVASDLAAKAPLREHEYRVLHKDGTYREFHVARRTEYDRAGDPVAFVGYCLDVTASKQMEEAIREAEEKYRTLVERIPAVVYFAEFGTAGPWTYVSPRVESILGFPPEEWLADPALWMRQVHPDDFPRVMEEEDRSRADGVPFVSEYRMLTRDGRVVWVRDEAEVVEDVSGKPSHLRGLMLDITDRKRAEEERREAEERFQRMAASVTDAIVEIDDRACITFWNAAAERLFGFSPSEALGRPLHSLIAPQEHLEAFTKGFDSFRGTGQGPLVGTVTEIEALRRDGTRFPVEVSVSAARHDDTWGAVGIVRDISERKRAEEELRENLDLLRRTDAERRRLLERLVGGQEEERRSLASDIYDGPLDKLSALGLRLSALRKLCSESAQLETIAQLEGILEQTIGSLRHLVFELLPPALERDGLAVALRVYLDEAANEAGFDYHLENDLVDEPPPETRTILYRIAQEALNNVRKHARATRVDVLLEPREGGFFVRVQDDGTGFAPEEAAATLTGAVGLTAMRERADMAGGWWRVESAPGRGTTVEFWLPAPPPPADPSAARVSRSGVAGRRRGGAAGRVAPRPVFSLTDGGHRRPRRSAR